MNSPSSLSSMPPAPNWDRDFISDQAHQFLRLELDNGARTPSIRDNLLLERCTAHLMALCNCSRCTAETHAAQAVAELASYRCRFSFDMDRSTAYALFVTDHAASTTRVISAAELMQLLQQAEATSAAQSA